MTAVLEERQIWQSMPGWGIAADLTPAELIASRKLKTLQKILTVALAAVIVACVAGYGVAFMQHRSAQSALSARSDSNMSLQAKSDSFSDVVRMQQGIAQVQTQLSGLMGSDVDAKALLAKINAALPNTVDLTKMTATVSGAAVQAGSQTSTNAGLDTSGHAVIGKVQLEGQASSFPAFASYIDALSDIPGVVDILPTSAQRDSGRIVSWKVSFNLTDQLLTQRYMLSKNGVN